MKNRVRNAEDLAAIQAAGLLIREGKLVAFPTETVYGLGANALDADAVQRIFDVKGRPAGNPLIVHVASVGAARELVSVWPEPARILAERFWPGPLTLVLPKSPAVPDVVTAGGPTVGIRIPAHPAALAFLKAAGVPVAAPSANKSEQLSPTTAQHVAETLGVAVDLILDGGPTDVGLESTVVDLTSSPPRILRPGMVTREMLEQAVGEVVVGAADDGEIERSPGRMPRHYAPRAAVTLCARGTARPQAGEGLLQLAGASDGRFRAAEVIEMPCDVAGYAAMLYAALHDLDARGVRRIYIETPPETGAWAAVHDRLRRAAAPRGES